MARRRFPRQRRRSWRRPAAVLVLLGLQPASPVVAGTATAVGQDSLTRAVRTLIDGAQLPWARWADISRYVDDLDRLYLGRDGLVWLDDGRLGSPGRTAVAALGDVDRDGLDPSDYDGATLDSLAQALAAMPAAAERAQFDLLLSVDLMRYLDDLRSGRTRRDFSHGCIRVAAPVALAAWLLRDQPARPRDSVRAAMAAPATRRVLLTQPIPVVAFYDDLYGHDRELNAALRAGPTTP